jgi:hypothetical protein
MTIKPKEARDKSTALLSLWTKAKNGNREALDELYAIAQQTLTEPPNSSDALIAQSVWKVLSDASADEDGTYRWVTNYGNVIIPEFKQAICKNIGNKVDEKAVYLFIHDRAKMFPILAKYKSYYGTTRDPDYEE